MSKETKREDEAKKFNIDNSTYKGTVITKVIEIVLTVIITPIITPLITPVIEGINRPFTVAILGLVNPSMKQLTETVFGLPLKQITLQWRLNEMLCRHWCLLATFCLIAIIFTIIKYIYAWIQERKLLRHKTEWRAKRLKKEIEREERENLSLQYFEAIEEYRLCVTAWKNRFRKRILIIGGAFVYFLGIGAVQYFPQVQTILHSMEAEIAADRGMDGIIMNLERETENNDWTVDANVSFILEKPDRLLELSSEQMQKIFYITLDVMEDNENEVRDHLWEISDADRVSNTDKCTNIEKGVISEASVLERIFLDKIAEAKTHGFKGNYEDWNDTIPTSATLDSVIDKREIFWSSDLQSDRSNGELCFLLANCFQKYAQEYANQGGKTQTVVYYYAMSVLWTERAMSYSDITEENEKLYYDYLKARYKDISDYLLRNFANMSENEILTYYEVQLKAEMIYNAM